MAIAMLVGSYLSVKRLKRRRVDFTLFIKHSTSFFLAAIILSRIVYFTSHPDTYFPGFDLRTLQNFVSIWDQGFSFWGAALGFFLMMSYHIRKANEPFWKWMDALSVPVLVGILIGFIGTFLGGYSYGLPTDLPWGIQYESFNVKYTVPVHPTQLYYVIFIGLLLWSKQIIKKKNDFFETDGNASLYFFTVYFMGSFLLEFLRGDDTLLILGVRLPTYFFGTAFLVSGYYLLRQLRNNKSKDNGPV
jgi:prolipoprotein diacylglyceryltransferase